MVVVFKVGDFSVDAYGSVQHHCAGFLNATHYYGPGADRGAVSGMCRQSDSKEWYIYQESDEYSTGPIIYCPFCGVDLAVGEQTWRAASG